MYLYENSAVFFILIVEFVVTIVFLTIEQIGYHKMMKMCSEEIKSSNILKNIFKKKKNVNNVDNYVNKYVSNFEICGLKLYTIRRLCGQLLNFVFITWCMVCIYGIYLEVGVKDILWTTMLGILLVGGLFSIGYSVDNLKYEYIAKVNLKTNIEEYMDRIEQLHNEVKYESETQLWQQDWFNTATWEKESSVYPTPEEKRQKMRNAVMASDCKNGKYIVELNNENLGYLSDY